MTLTRDNDTLVFALLSPNWTNSWWLLIIGNWDETDPAAEDDIQIKVKQADEFCVLITQFIFTNMSWCYILFK